MTQKQKLILIAVLFLGIFFRFYLINLMPGGLFPDEAANGLDIISMQQGNLQPFYERGNGREALFFYMLWASVETFGKGPWQHHIVSALVGIGSVMSCFLVAKLLFSKLWKSETLYSKFNFTGSPASIALIASFLMAVSSWNVVLSRTAFRANLIPLFTALTIYFLLKSFTGQTQRAKILWAAASGIAFGLGFYTYIAYRIMVPVIIAAVLWPMISDLFTSARQRWRDLKNFYKPMIALKIATLITILPLAYYFLTHPGSFVGRSGQVSIFNPELNKGDLLGTFWQVFSKSILAYFTNGDLNWRHNISGEPFLPVFVSPFFAIGLITAIVLGIRYAIFPLKYKQNWKDFILTGWFFAMLIPVVTTAEGIPHGLRSIGTIPSVFIISAYGIWICYAFISKLRSRYIHYLPHWHSILMHRLKYVLIAAFVLTAISHTYILYFVKAYNDEENFYSFRTDLTEVSRYLNWYGNKANTYLALDKFSIQTVDYLTMVDSRNPDNPRNRPFVQVDPERSYQISGIKPKDKVVFTQSSLFDIKKFRENYPDTEEIFYSKNKFNQKEISVWQINSLNSLKK